MAMVTPRAVIFDLDGTLVDSTAAIVYCFHKTFDHFGVPRATAPSIIGVIGAPLEDQFRLFWPEGDPAECARVYRMHYAEVCRPMTQLLPGARGLLEACRDAGLEVGFATSKRLCYAEIVMEHLGVLDFFAARIGPDEVTRHKPHPEAVERCAATLGVPAAACFFIGDTHYDVGAGKAAGARVLCVTTGPAERAALEALGPEAVYDHLDAVRDHILAALRPVAGKP